MSVVDLVQAYPVAAAIAVAGVTAAYFLSSKKGSGAKKSSKDEPALSPDEFRKFELSEKIVVSPDTRIFRFKLRHPTQRLGLPIGQHMYVRASIDGKDVQRAYTPVSSDDDLGYFDLLIKVYFPNVHPKFPEGGKLSQHMERLQIGDSIDVKGPIGRFEYLGNGNFRVKKGKEFVERTVKSFGMIAGGTGITPMRQIMKAILKDPKDRTQVHLLFANQTEDDILLREELDQYAKTDDRVKVWYTLDRPNEETWKFSQGFVSFEMVEKHMPKASADSCVLMCGPLPMINFACKPNLEKAGYTEDQLFAF
jgi:cytochrome-b5 reductase